MSINRPIIGSLVEPIIQGMDTGGGGGPAVFRLVGSHPPATVGVAYSWKPTALNGVAPITFALTGDLPDGLSFDTDDGEIHGTPTEVWSDGFTITATDDTSAEAVLHRTLMVNATVPGAPTIGTATAGNAEASVAFTAPGSDGGSAITGYTVTSDPGGITASGASSPIVVSGLTNDTEYTFTVTGTNAVGTGPASAASNAVTPSSTPPLTEQVQALYVKYSASGSMLDLTDASTLFQNSNGTGVVANGDPVGYAADLSGSGNPAKQSTASYRPAYSPSGVLYDGVDDGLVCELSPTGGYRIYMAVAVKARAAVSYLFDTRETGDSTFPGFVYRNNNNPMDGGGVTNLFEPEPIAPNSGTPSMLDTGYAVTQTSTRLSLGCRFSPGDDPVIGHIRRVVAINASPSVDDVALIRQWLMEGV